MSGVDVSTLILSAHILFKRKEFGKYSNTSVQAASHGECVKSFMHFSVAYVEPNKRKHVYEVLLKFALKSLDQYGSKESLIFLMLIVQLCTGKDILYDNVTLLRKVVSSHVSSLNDEKSDLKG